MKILVAGEINVDLILQDYSSFPELGKEVLVRDSLLTLGSASAICAVGLARLGNQVAFLGRVGHDAYGEFCVAAMSAADIDVSHIVYDPVLKTGITVSITGPQDRALVTYMGAIGALRGSDFNLDWLASFRHFHLSSYFLQNELRPDCPRLFAEARRRGLTTSLDPGFDPAERWRGIADLLSEVDVFFPNEVELSAITGIAEPDQALRRLANGRTLTIGKLGAKGCIALDHGTIIEVPSFPVQPVDTTGAGDSFNAGFLHARLGGAPLRDAMRFGAACGALSTLSPGGTTGQPGVADVERFLSAQR